MRIFRAFSILLLAVCFLGYTGGDKVARAGEMTSEVTVYEHGRPSKGHRVSFEFDGLFGGFTKDFYTDSSGVAYVKHVSSGKVKVYVDGNHSNHGTTGTVPGRINVYLK